MNTWTKYDVATVAIGLTSVASLASLLLSGDLRFAAVEDAAIGVAVVLGVLAILAGALMQPRLAAVVGLMFLAAAALQVVLVTLRETWLGGNTATAALWLGLGIGLLVLGVSRPTAEVKTVSEGSDTE